MNKVSLPLCIADEPRIASFDFSKQVTVRVSLANPGAEDLANELAKSFARLTVSTAEAADDATHMLLYLNRETWSDERLAEQVKQAREDKLKIVMAHENDPDKGGCIFARFFETTPQELINDGLYRDMAHPCFPRDWPHHEARARFLPPSPPSSSPPPLSLALRGAQRWTCHMRVHVGVARAPGKEPRRDRHEGPPRARLGGPPPNGDLYQKHPG